MGALLHTVNHALIKSLLFLGAGAVNTGTRTLEIDRLGGLQKHMPKTAAAILTGSVAICGLPPLNGFVGELLLFLAACGAAASNPADGTFAAAGMAALMSLGLIGGLAAAGFAGLYGTVFLGESRSEQARTAGEVPPAMIVPMIALAGGCVLGGFGAPLGAMLVSPAAEQIAGPAAVAAMTPVIPLLMTIAACSGAIALAALLLAVLRRRLLRGRTIVIGPTWDCGYEAPTARMQYTGSSFTWPMAAMFHWLIRPCRQVRMDGGEFPDVAGLNVSADDLFYRHLYTPLFRAAVKVSQYLYRLFGSRNQLNILYIAITIILLLVLKVG